MKLSGLSESVPWATTALVPMVKTRTKKPLVTVVILAASFVAAGTAGQVETVKGTKRRMGILASTAMATA